MYHRTKNSSQGLLWTFYDEVLNVTKNGFGSEADYHSAFHYYLSRSRLRQFFDTYTPVALSKSQQLRCTFLDKAILAIPKQMPLLAAETYEVLGYTEPWYPYFYFLKAGFDECVVKKIISCFPEAPAHEQKQGQVDNYVVHFKVAGILGVRVPFDTFKRVLEIAPAQARSGRLLQILFMKNYRIDILAYVQRFVLTDSFTYGEEHGPLSLNLGKAVVLTKVMPQLRELNLLIGQSPEAAIVLVLRCLPECNKLEKLDLDLPANTIADSVDALEALRTFLETKVPSLQQISLKIIKDSVNYTEEGYEIYDRKRKTCLESILGGIMQAQTGYFIEELALGLFAPTESTVRIFELDMIGSLYIGGCRSPLKDVAHLKTSSGVRVGRLNLSCANLSPALWPRMWQAVATARNLDKVVVRPGNPSLFSSRDIESVVQGSFSSPQLTELRLDYYTTWGNEYPSIDVSAGLIACLQRGVLESVEIEGSRAPKDWEETYCLDYCVNDVEALCNALKDNSSLRVLHLRGVDFCGAHCVSKRFLKILDLHNNTTIEDIEVCDDEQFFSVLPEFRWPRERNWRHLENVYSYENYAQARQLEYLTRLNRFGRGKNGNNIATIESLVMVLGNVDGSLFADEDDKKEVSTYLGIAQDAREDGNNSNEHLSRLFGASLENPLSWCNIVNWNMEALSLRFDLLRCSPSLWSLSI